MLTSGDLFQVLSWIETTIKAKRVPNKLDGNQTCEKRTRSWSGFQNLLISTSSFKSNSIIRSFKLDSCSIKSPLLSVSYFHLLNHIQQTDNDSFCYSRFYVFGSKAFKNRMFKKVPNIISSIT